MKIKGFELRRINMPLVSPFRTSFGTQDERDVLIIRAETPDAEGWGECVAGTDPLYSSEYVDAAEHVIRNHLIPRLFASIELSAGQVAEILRPVKGHAMSKGALEIALLDAELKSQGTSLSSYLGAVREEVNAGVSVGIFEKIDMLVAAVEDYLAQGYQRIKLKIEPGWDYEPVKTIREKFGDILLQVDANAAYSLSDARHLSKLDAFDLLLIEQPLPEEEVRAHAELAKLVKTPICLDESITSARAAFDAISMGACSIVNIKAGRVGGYIEARKVHDVCAAAGVPVWCGGMLETGIGRAANVALAALPNFKLPGDTSASDRFYKKDITPPFVLNEGRLKVPKGPGIGVQVLTDVLDEITTRKDYVIP
jgi:O-succinylbenzoate synthase